MAHQNTIETILFDGGTLCFDFVNTVKSRKVTEVHNYLASYAAFITWAKRVAVLPEIVLQNLHASSQKQPEQAGAALEKILAVRENLYLVFSAIAAQRVPAAQDLAAFNQNLGNALARVLLSWPGKDYAVGVDPAKNDLTGPLAVILYSAYQVLDREDRARIKECAECGWLFLDKTKNGKRQWCNPVYCGSTTKARRYYHRQKDKEQNYPESTANKPT